MTKLTKKKESFYDKPTLKGVFEPLFWKMKPKPNVPKLKDTNAEVKKKFEKLFYDDIAYGGKYKDEVKDLVGKDGLWNFIDQALTDNTNEVIEKIEKELPYEFVKFGRDAKGFHWDFERRVGYNQCLAEVKCILYSIKKNKKFDKFKLHDQKDTFDILTSLKEGNK